MIIGKGYLQKVSGVYLEEQPINSRSQVIDIQISGRKLGKAV